MAEALASLGAVAAAVQLAEVLLKSVRLAKHFEGLPDELSDVLQDVERSITSMHYVCTTLVPALSGHTNATIPSALTEIVRAVAQCLQEIQTTLQPVVGPVQSTKGKFAQRVLRPFKAFNIEKEISDKLHRLDRLNVEVNTQLQVVDIDLQMAFHTTAAQAATGIQTDQTRILDTLQTQHRDHSADMSAQHAATVNQLGAIQSTDLDTQARTAEVQSTVAGIGGFMHTMQKDFTATVSEHHNTTTTLLADISSTSQDTHAIVTEIRGTTVNTDAKVNNIVDDMMLLKLHAHEQKQERQEHFSQMNDLMACLTGVVDQLSAKSQQRMSSLSEGGQLLVQQHAQSRLLRYPSALAAAKRTWKPCRCRPIHHVSYSSRWGVRVRTETSQDHRSDCPYFHRGTRTSVSSIRMALTPFVNATMELAIGATTGAGGWALAPPLRFRGIVRRSESPLFRAFAETVFLCFHSVEMDASVESCEERARLSHLSLEKHGLTNWIPEAMFSEVYDAGYVLWDISVTKATLVRLGSRLMEEVECGRASGTDTDENGETLLFVSLGLAMIVTEPLLIPLRTSLS